MDADAVRPPARGIRRAAQDRLHRGRARARIAARDSSPSAAKTPLGGLAWAWRCAAGELADKNEAAYRKRLIVPEPERFYARGAGRPLLAALVNIPPLALVALATRNGPGS